MTLVLPAEVAKNGVIERKRRFSNDLNSDHGETKPSRKIARKDSLSQDHVTSKKETKISDRQELELEIPTTQNVLLLYGKRQPYTLTPGYEVPQITPGKDEVLIKVKTIGLNPIDWKAPDYGFGIPVLPYIAGRDILGVVIDSADIDGTKSSQRIKHGDIVLTASTDYRDLRKAAYQEYAVASRYNLCRVPVSLLKDELAGLGVAFVAAALAMCVCFGCDFTTLDKTIRGPDLKSLLKGLESDNISKDVRDECLGGISAYDRPKPGEWIAIWGGSSATGLMVAQLAKLFGLRVINVVDLKKHGRTFSAGPADLLVDSHDPERAIQIVQGVTENKLYFGIDTVGKQTAELLQKSLHQWNAHEIEDSKTTQGRFSHLVGLTGLPKLAGPGVKHHAVPIKIHHEVGEIGEALMIWLEALLEAGKIIPPDAVVVNGGLGSINANLDRMRRGEVSGKRLVVKLS